MHKTKGFTLIELLVVISIIAILIAIFVPVLAKSRQRTRTVVCQANLHQWGIILEMYTDNNNGCFFGGFSEGWWNDWIEILRPSYVKKGGITCCPEATKTLDKGGHGVFAAWNDEEGDYGSYGLSSWVCNVAPGPSAVFGDELYWRISNVRGAGNIPVFMDSLVISGWPDHTSIPPAYNGEWTQNVTLTEQMKGFCIDRHGRGTTNCLFMDWSVRPVGLKELWKLRWHRKFDLNAPSPEWPDWMKNFKDH